MTSFQIKYINLAHHFSIKNTQLKLNIHSLSSFILFDLHLIWGYFPLVKLGNAKENLLFMNSWIILMHVRVQTQTLSCLDPEPELTYHWQKQECQRQWQWQGEKNIKSEKTRERKAMKFWVSVPWLVLNGERLTSKTRLLIQNGPRHLCSSFL